MKQIFLSLVLTMTAGHLLATIRTVSNTPATIAQFNTINAAIAASASGDTIYIHGSPNQYGNFTISNKRLVLLGPGWSPDKSLGFDAVIQGCTITGAASSNTEIHGLAWVSALNMSSAHPDNLRFIRNNFASIDVNINEGGVTYTGYLFEGNLFSNATLNATTGSTYTNFLIQNNYLYENGTVRDGNFNGFFNSINVLFNHNLWFGPGSGTRNVATSNNNRFLTFTNNIFVRREPASSISLSTFTNNITFNAGTNNPWAVNGNVDAGGNVTNQDPQMTAQTAVNAGTNNPLNDFTIAAGPANNSGTDGKDMGLLYDITGSLNWNNARNSRLPRIFSMNVVNPTVAAGANVTVNVEARTSN
jgi:hypothetical protein